MEEGWERRREPVCLDPAVLAEAVRTLANTRPFAIEGPLRGGLVNQSYRIRLRGPEEDAVLRVYLRDPAAAAKEAAVLERVGDAVPAARVLHRDYVAGHPCSITTWVPGSALAAHLDSGSSGILRAAREAGAAAARLHAHGRRHMGLLDDELTVADPMPGIRGAFQSLLAPLLEAGRPGQHLGTTLRGALLDFFERGLDPLEDLEGRYAIVHADFKPTNVFVDAEGGLTGLLDWEFAWAGPPLIDLGQMLRWPTPPGFEEALGEGYRDAGGVLSPGWRSQARILDLLNLVTILDTPEERPVLTRDVKRMIAETIGA